MHLTLSYSTYFTYRKAQGSAVINFYIFFSISSTNILINDKKEAIAFYIITQKRRTKPFLLFIDSYVNSFKITHFNSEIVPQKAVAKLQSEF